MNARCLVVAVLMACTAGCGYGIKSTMATTDYDTQVDLSKYSTFFMIKGNSSGDRAADDRLISDVEAAITRKGWLEVPEGEGQVAIVVHTATTANHTYRSFFEGWGGWRWEGPEGARRFAEEYQVGTVVVTIFDAETKRAMWRGFASDAPAHDPQHNAKAGERAVAKIFSHFPTAALDRPQVDTATAHTDAQTSTLPVTNVPPAIIFSTSPAVLVLIDGDPIYRPVPGTELQRVVNTKPLIVRDVAGMSYLKILDGWMETYSLDSNSWTVAGVMPDGGHVALQQAVAEGTVDRLDHINPNNRTGTSSLANGRAPAVFTSTTPAELIVTDGPMRFATIEGTSLEYVVNTSADVFREPTDHELYVLTSGQWFRAWTTEGPWQVVVSSELPADFARIPDGSPQARVKASVKASVGGDRR